MPCCAHSIASVFGEANNALLGRWRRSPPFNGFTHTVLPLFERELLVISDECVRNDGKD